MNRQMKDSGIAWIGEIPEGWDIKRGRHLYSITTGKLDANAEVPEGEYPFFTCSMYPKKIDSYAFDCEALLVAGNGLVGFAQYYKGKFNAYQRTYVLFDFNGVYPHFLKHYVTGNLSTELEPKSIGSVIQFIKLVDLQNFNIAIPPLSEQRGIAEFLDTKCAEVDELLKVQEAFIDELKAYKQSLITETVTKGLDPTAKMKNSGVEWIGDIPDGWSKEKVVRLFSVIGSGTTPKDSNNDTYGGTINWIQSGDINGGILLSSKNKIKEEALLKFPALKVYHAPFIILAMYGASVGNISISKIDGCVNQACCVLSSSNQDFNYLFYALKSVKDYLIYRAEGGGQPNISQDKVRGIWLPVPPLAEQEAIAAYLDTKCAEIDQLIALKQEKIETLQDYRKSLIYEYVTGKKQL